VVAMVAVILSAVYMLNMIQRVFYGGTNALTERGVDIKMNERFVLVVLVVIIVVVGVYPRPVLDFTKESAEFILKTMTYKQ